MRNIYLYDIARSDAYLNGLVPLMQQIHMESLGRLDSSQNPREVDYIEVASEEKFMIKLRQRIVSASNMAKIEDKAITKINFITDSAHKMALNVLKLKETLDLACRKICSKGK